MRFLARLFVLFAMMLAGAACSTYHKPGQPKAEGPTPSTTYNLHVDELFSSNERAIVIDAFTEWERDTHGVVKFTVSKRKWNSDKDDVPDSISTCTHEVYVAHLTSKDKSVKSIEKMKGKDNGRPFTILGYASSDCEKRIVVLVMDRLANPVLLRNVAVHESGHLIGLDHIPVPNESVMYPSMDKASKCPTVLDMKQLCSIHKCDWRETDYCKTNE